MPKQTTAILGVVLLLAVAAAAATLVQEDGKAPYYKTVEAALEAASDDQLVLIKFETDW